MIFSQSIISRLDSLFKTIYHSNDPGAVVAIKDKDKIIFKKGYGVANLQKATKLEASTNLNIGSLTKQFTAYSILQLVEKGSLLLDDKLIKFFPVFNPKTGNIITVRHLLTHSSGIVDHYGYTDTNKIKHATDMDVLNAVKNVDTTIFTPGEHYRYSNTAYCLLALIIEKLSGLSYSDYVEKNIFKPLGMQHSTVLKIGSPIYMAAMGYTVNDNNSQKKQFELLDADQSIFFSTEGDGGVYTSIDDYLKWCGAWRNGNTLNQALIADAQSSHFLIDASQKLSYGYGWFVSEKNNEKIVYHTGSNGGFRAISFFIPARSYQVIIFSNRDDIDLEDLLQKINTILLVSNASFSKIEKLTS
jgi:CubicO group peptidase (beta-lactamase class C family)